MNLYLNIWDSIMDVLGFYTFTANYQCISAFVSCLWHLIERFDPETVYGLPILKRLSITDLDILSMILFFQSVYYVQPHGSIFNK